MDRWTTGYTAAELEEAQERYHLRFPPDLLDLLRERQPMDGYDWRTENAEIRRMLNWPFKLLLLDMEQGFWWPDWGERPDGADGRTEILRDALDRAPKLIPLYSHRFLPAHPCTSGNPVFSMHGFDTIYYGSDLANYFDREFGRQPHAEMGPIRHIDFWSDTAEGFDRAYAFYAAADDNRAALRSIQNLLRANSPPPDEPLEP